MTTLTKVMIIKTITRLVPRSSRRSRRHDGSCRRWPVSGTDVAEVSLGPLDTPTVSLIVTGDGVTLQPVEQETTGGLFGSRLWTTVTLGAAIEPLQDSRTSVPPLTT